MTPGKGHIIKDLPLRFVPTQEMPKRLWVTKEKTNNRYKNEVYLALQSVIGTQFTNAVCLSRDVIKRKEPESMRQSGGGNQMRKRLIHFSSSAHLSSSFV